MYELDLFYRPGQRLDRSLLANMEEWRRAVISEPGQRCDGYLSERGCLELYTEDQILQRGFVFQDPESGPLLTPITNAPN